MGTICVSSYANIFMSEFEEKYIYPLIRNKSVIYLPSNQKQSCNILTLHTWKSIPFSPALRIKRICSTFEEYRKHSQDLIKRFIDKGYNESTVRKQVERVNHLDRLLLLKHSKPKRKDTIPFSLTYNPVLPNIKEIINKHWHILSIDGSFKEIFKSLQPMIAFRKNTCCQQVLKTGTSTQTRETFTIFHQVTCHSNYVIYLLECVMFKIQHVGKSETSFNIRLYNYRKDIKKPSDTEACKHFNNNKNTFSKHGKFIIIEQLQNINFSLHWNTKIGIERNRTFLDQET